MALGYGRVGTNNFGTAKFIVDTNGIQNGATHSTIAGAITDASSGDTIFVRDGTYTEDLTLVDDVHIVGNGADTVTIVGKATATFAGQCSIRGVTLQTNADFFLVVSGANATVVRIFESELDSSDNTGISHTSSGSGSVVSLNYCSGNTGTTGVAHFASTSAGNIEINYCKFDNDGNSTTASTFGGSGTLNMKYVAFAGVLTTSSTGVANLRFVFFFTANINTACLNAGNTNTNVSNSWFNSGTATAMTVTGTLQVASASIKSTNATSVISGAGTLQYSNLNFVETGDIITATTQTPLVQQTGALQVTIPTSWPHTATPQDGVLCIDSSGGARGVTLPASPATGMELVIKDFDGNAASNNITITPAAGNIDGSATYVISSDYGSVKLVYTGSEWSII